MSKFTDLTSKKFGKLTVVNFIEISRGRSLWQCKCECGGEKVATAANLHRDLNANCGCENHKFNHYSEKEIIGQKFGKLTAIKIAQRKPTLWLCKCDCGGEKLEAINHLTRGYVKSCGCTARNLSGTSSNGMSPQEYLFSIYKKGADQRNLNWGLSFEDFLTITSSNCHYCGCPPKMEKATSAKSIPYIYNGIDRVDASKGYTLNNVVTSCRPCNFAKGKQSYEEFMEWINQLIAYRTKIIS